MPELQIANNANHSPQPDLAPSSLHETPNHNLTTLDTESNSELSGSSGSVISSRSAATMLLLMLTLPGRPGRRFRDRLKAALHLGDDASNKAGAMYSDEFEEIIHPCKSSRRRRLRLLILVAV